MDPSCRSRQLSSRGRLGRLGTAKLFCRLRRRYIAPFKDGPKGVQAFYVVVALVDGEHGQHIVVLTAAGRARTCRAADPGSCREAQAQAAGASPLLGSGALPQPRLPRRLGRKGRVPRALLRTVSDSHLRRSMRQKSPACPCRRPRRRRHKTHTHSTDPGLNLARLQVSAGGPVGRHVARVPAHSRSAAKLPHDGLLERGAATHAHTHTRMHTHTHAHTHARTHTGTHARAGRLYLSRLNF